MHEPDSNSVYLDAPATTIDGDDVNRTIDMTAVLSPLLLHSRVEESLAPVVSVSLPYVASPGVSEWSECIVEEEDVDKDKDEDEDDDSFIGDHYFSLPDNFGDNASAAINVEKHFEDLASLSYSETSEDEKDDDNASALIMEEFEETNTTLGACNTILIAITSDGGAMNVHKDVANSPSSLVFTESTQVLLNEEVIENDGGIPTTEDELKSVVNNDDDLSKGVEWDKATSSTTAPLLGSIWVKHPKHGCMVRRSSRLVMLSRLRLGLR